MNIKRERVIRPVSIPLFKIINDGPSGSQLSISECRDLFEFFGKEFPEKEERLYDLKEFGYSPTQQWFEVFETEPEDSLYIRNMMEGGEELSKEARVKLSTIHSAKGGEADNVLLIMDNTKTIRKLLKKALIKKTKNTGFGMWASRVLNKIYILWRQKRRLKDMTSKVYNKQIGGQSL